MAGKPWYNNGTEEIQRGVDEIIPEGFVRGRLPKSKESIEKQKQTMLNKTEEELKDIQSRRSASVSRAYNSKSDEEKHHIISKRVESLKNVPDRAKHISESTKGKNLGKTPWNKGLTAKTDDRVRISHKHSTQSLIRTYERLKQEDPEYFYRVNEKRENTQRINNTFNTSKVEEELYLELTAMYGDVKRQYKDSRYPFKCDFYIPSEDLFIELNGTWTHGGHPFDINSIEDMKKAIDWCDKDTLYYDNALFTWCERDVKKQLTAKKNNLNYTTIY